MSGAIVWLNGAFGVGKTTAANEICKLRDWRHFDPEHVGYMLGANLRDVAFDDFQDLPPWRALVPVVAHEVQRFTGQNLIAVQTVLVEDYWSELRSGLTSRGANVGHVLLDCDPLELRRRIEADSVERDALGWRLDHIEAFTTAREWLVGAADVVVDTTGKPPEEVSRSVVESVAGLSF